MTNTTPQKPVDYPEKSKIPKKTCALEVYNQLKIKKFIVIISFISLILTTGLPHSNILKYARYGTFFVAVAILCYFMVKNEKYLKRLKETYGLK